MPAVVIGSIQLIGETSLHIESPMVKCMAAKRVRMLHVLETVRAGNDARTVRPINDDPAASIQAVMDEHAVLGTVYIHDGAVGRFADDVAVAVLRFGTAGRSWMTDKSSRLNRAPRRLVADQQATTRVAIGMEHD